MPETSHDIVDTIGYAIHKMALIDDEAARISLKEEACGYTLEKWNTWLTTKVIGTGIATGLVPGPLGMAAEALDIVYLMAACGRACYGVGYIVRGDVDYDKDIPLILSLWAEGANAAVIGGGGKIGIKVGGKLGIVMGTAAAKKVGAKMLTKVAPKVAAKFAAKLGAKFVSSWIPFLGSAVSCGINWWVASSLMEAAERYYRAEVIMFEDSSELRDDLLEIVEHYGELCE